MDIWKHGKYVDLWSLVHFLSGFLLGAIFFALGYTFLTALLLSTILLLLWEAFEWLTKISEPSVNVAMDMVVGLAGFLAGAYLYYFLDVPFEMLHFSILLTATLLLSLWGFFDFLKRGYR
jgi:hypothetical protein